MPEALSGPIGIARDQDHAERGTQARQCAHIAHRQVRQAKSLDDQRQEETDRIDAIEDASEGDGDGDDLRVQDRGQQPPAMRCLPRRLRIQLPLQPHLLGRSEPGGLGGPVAQHRVAEQRQQHCRRPFREEHPLPTGDAQPPVKLQDMRRQRRADDAGDRARGEEAAHHAAAIPGREPAGHEVGDAGEISGLGHAKQETGGDETRFAFDEGGAGGCQSPDRHDDGEPGARSQLAQCQVGGDLAEHVAPEIRAGRHAVGCGAETQGLVHGERGDRHVVAVERVDDVADAQVGNQPPCHLAHHGSFDIDHDRSPTLRAAPAIVRRSGRAAPAVRDVADGGVRRDAVTPSRTVVPALL